MATLTTSQPTFWQRVGTMFRGNGRVVGPSPNRLDDALDTADGGAIAALERGTEQAPPRGTAPDTDPSADRTPLAGPLLDRGTERPPTEQAAEAPTEPSSGGRFALGWKRKRPSDAAMRERYERVGRLLDSLREHFEHQDRRAEQIGLSVGRMADVLEKLPELQASQSECMQAIAGHLGTANRHSAELRDTLTRVPTSIQAQAEAISSLSRQMATGNKSDMQMVGALQRLARVVNGLGITNRNQVDTLQRMRTEFDQQRESLATIIREQSRRYIVTAVVAGIVTIASLAALLIVLAV